jgi:pimeloyl-ACP methyl ester carboxylesterase
MTMHKPLAAPVATTTAPARIPSGYVRTCDNVDLYYKDWGEGRPIVFVHGWGLPSPMWDYQIVALRSAGFRCIAYDRRGHGRSTAAEHGYDYDRLADDLAALLDELDLTDVVLVGHSMGSGELVRYVTRHGTRRLGGLVFVAPAATPYATWTPDNSDGLPAEMLEAFRTRILVQDYPGWLEANRAPFFTPETSEAMQMWLVKLMLETPLHVLIACNRSVTGTDFRAELPKITVPSLVIHGDKDVSAPLAFGRETAWLIPNARFILYEGAPHGLFITHKERLNADLEAFASA